MGKEPFGRSMYDIGLALPSHNAGLGYQQLHHCGGITRYIREAIDPICGVQGAFYRKLSVVQTRPIGFRKDRVILVGSQY
ncbi:predicted protein [Plenodomus lingam JN3]|uniref:Predicted protein n=1 Tax=Leptosphaeria maculans (strain JN3 / isolate v23.1.3 / race Av1-4-5-6-7-8) TaxID=985895 RepID=E5A9Z2_LEPMJ|nr:predicted protein [Plenodomus lingam JN3]CBY00483.1 predicted protein [Plenodomus lingam JN3]